MQYGGRSRDDWTYPGVRFTEGKLCGILKTKKSSVIVKAKTIKSEILYVTIYIMMMMARMEEGKEAHKVLVGKPEGKGLLGRPRRRWEDNIKMDLQEVGRGYGDWMELA